MVEKKRIPDLQQREVPLKDLRIRYIVIELPGKVLILHKLQIVAEAV